MRMKVLGIIFAGGRGETLGLLTTKRASAAVPIAGKYRAIDFTLSNMVHSGLIKMGVLTQYSPRSLFDHLGAGKEWDLDRKHGGLMLLQPYIGADTQLWYQGTADAVFKNMTFLRRSDEDYVLIGSGDHIYTFNFAQMFSYHFAKGADITFLYKELNDSYTPSEYGIIQTAEDGRIVDFVEKPKKPMGTKAFMGVYFINKHLLMDLLYHSIPHSQNFDLLLDVLLPNLQRLRFFAYEYKGYWRNIKKGIWEYYRTNMDLLDSNIRKELFYSDVTIHTKLKDLPPPKCTNTAFIKNSIISDGCVISGRVLNSIVSRGVRVKSGASVENSILMQDCVVEEGAQVKFSILDKETLVRNEKRVIGRPEDLMVYEKGSVI